MIVYVLSEVGLPVLLIRIGEQFEGIVLQVRLSRYFVSNAFIVAGLLRGLQPVH